MILEELKKNADAVNLHDACLIKFKFSNNKLRLVYDLGGYHCRGLLEKIFKNPEKNSLILAQEFTIKRIINMEFDSQSLYSDFEIMDNDLKDGNIMFFYLLSSETNEFVSFEFEFSDFKWEIIGEFETSLICIEQENYKQCKISLLDNF